MKGLAAGLCAVAVLGAGPRAQAAERPTEYSSKAKILLMILPYVQWPSESSWKDESFRLAVLGESPFGTRLDEGTQSLTVHHRPIQIRYISKVRDAEGCQALFICASESRRIEGILAWAEGKEVLTLSDDETIARKGAMLNLLLEGGYVRLAVNPEAARRSNLVLGSRLLSLARTISPSQPTP